MFSSKQSHYEHKTEVNVSHSFPVPIFLDLSTDVSKANL